MSKNADKLKALRYTLGLTQAEMAKKIGVPESSVKDCEHGHALISKDKSSEQYKIKAFLEVQDISPAVIAKSKLFLELEERQRSIQRHFTEGKCYKILGSHKGKTPPYSLSWEYDCTFRFLRKEGIHHIFREVRGGWTRTYTDAQLVGKNIQEVQP